MSIALPELTYGKVVGRFLLAVGDAADADRTPDAKVPTGFKVTFTPAAKSVKVANPPATIVPKPITCTLNASGYLIDEQNALGVWLIAGVYKVSYSAADLSLPGHDIIVTAANTDAAPVDLTTAAPAGAILTATQYAAIDSRLTLLEAGGGGGGGSEAVAAHAADTTDVHGIADTAALATTAGVTAQVAAHSADTTDVHGIADTATLLTDADLADVVRTGDARLTDSRTSTAHTHTSAQVTDFAEAAQDAIAALLAGTNGVTLAYNDTANTLTITGPGVSEVDPEAVRDLVGVALVGVGAINIAVNDAADTITISTTATANSTDAALRDRTTHTGAQPISSVTGLQGALDAAVTSTTVDAIVSLSQAAYDALGSKAPTTLYVIV